jgi:hypothetical protein
MIYLIKSEILLIQEHYFDLKNFHNHLYLVDIDKNSFILPFSRKQIQENN